MPVRPREGDAHHNSVSLAARDPGQLHDGVMRRTLTLRLGENPRLAGLKHCNRLEQILARTELATGPGAGRRTDVQQLRQSGFRNHEQCVPGAATFGC